MIAYDDGGPLVCYGCAHSLGGESYPSGPSGERPCLFCIRHTNQAARISELADIRARLAPDKPYTARYDNGPTRKEPADQYISTDRLMRDTEEGSWIIT